MKKTTIVFLGVLIVLAVGVAGGYFYVNEQQSWTWDLPADEWTNITFTSEMFNCVGSDMPEDVLESILDVSGETWVFQNQPGVGWTSWWSEDPENSLEHILPDIPCSIHVEFSCTLIIERC